MKTTVRILIVVLAINIGTTISLFIDRMKYKPTPVKVINYQPQIDSLNNRLSILSHIHNEDMMLVIKNENKALDLIKKIIDRINN